MKRDSIQNFELVYYGGIWMGEGEPCPVIAAILLGILNQKAKKEGGNDDSDD